MDDYKFYLKTIFIAIIGFFEFIVGGLDSAIKTLLIFMAADILTGMRKAAMGHSDKSSKGFLDSEIMWKGGLKKGMILVVVCVATITDNLINPGSLLIRNLTVTYYSATEAISIMENISACGVSLPKPLVQALEKVRDENNSS